MTRARLTDVECECIGPYLPIGEYGPYRRLRRQFEDVVRRFRTGGQRREMPQESGAWSTVSHRFRQWRDAGGFEALLEGLIAEAAKRGEVDLSLVRVDSTTVRARHDAAGMHTSQDVLAALPHSRMSGFRWPCRPESGVVRHRRGAGPRSQARAAASRAKAAMMTATRT